MTKKITLVAVGCGFVLGLSVKSIVPTVKAQTVITQPSQTLIRASKAVSLNAGDRIVCGIDPSAYSVLTSSDALVDYTVPATHSLKGMLMLSGRQN